MTLADRNSGPFLQEKQRKEKKRETGHFINCYMGSRKRKKYKNAKKEEEEKKKSMATHAA